MVLLFRVIPKVDPNKFVAALFVGASSISTKGFAVPVSESQHGLRCTSGLRQQIGQGDGDDCERRKEYIERSFCQAKIPPHNDILIRI